MSVDYLLYRTDDITSCRTKPWLQIQKLELSEELLELGCLCVSVWHLHNNIYIYIYICCRQLHVQIYTKCAALKKYNICDDNKAPSSDFSEESAASGIEMHL